MTKEEEFFHKIADNLPNATKGKIFGAMGIKAANGKTAAIFWKDEIIVKLNAEDEKEALKLSESRPGTHLYAPEKKNEKLGHFTFCTFRQMGISN